MEKKKNLDSDREQLFCERPEVKWLERLLDSGTLTAKDEALIKKNVEIGKKSFADSCNKVKKVTDLLAAAHPESKEAEKLRKCLEDTFPQIFHDLPYDLSLKMINTFDEPASSMLMALLHQTATVTDTK
tara:strand:+ start:878 stop:1264 length:387 start_codon:yes stop_codon:yes gene_type:complete